MQSDYTRTGELAILILLILLVSHISTEMSSAVLLLCHSASQALEAHLLG